MQILIVHLSTGQQSKGLTFLRQWPGAIVERMVAHACGAFSAFVDWSSFWLYFLVLSIPSTARKFRQLSAKVYLIVETLSSLTCQNLLPSQRNQVGNEQQTHFLWRCSPNPALDGACTLFGKLARLVTVLRWDLFGHREHTHAVRLVMNWICVTVTCYLVLWNQCLYSLLQPSCKVLLHVCK